MRNVGNGKPGFRPDPAIGIGGLVVDATLSRMNMLARYIHAEQVRVAWYVVTLVITCYRASLTHVGV